MSIKIDNPTLIKYAGSYSFQNGNTELISSHEITDEARNTLRYNKKFLQPRSNKAFKAVRKTLNLVDRMYDSVSKKHGIVKKMPLIKIHLVDRTNQSNLYLTTSSALGCATMGSNIIQLKLGFISRSLKNNVIGLEHVILHELGHAIFRLPHCKKRKNPCPIMARFGSNISNDDKKAKQKQRRRFKRFIKNKYFTRVL